MLGYKEWWCGLVHHLTAGGAELGFSPGSPMDEEDKEEDGTGSVCVCVCVCVINAPANVGMR